MGNKIRKLVISRIPTYIATYAPSWAAGGRAGLMILLCNSPYALIIFIPTFYNFLFKLYTKLTVVYLQLPIIEVGTYALTIGGRPKHGSSSY